MRLLNSNLFEINLSKSIFAQEEKSGGPNLKYGHSDANGPKSFIDYLAPSGHKGLRRPVRSFLSIFFPFSPPKDKFRNSTSISTAQSIRSEKVSAHLSQPRVCVRV
ncbi:hypothetical protein SCA6_004483 [Theobroma cacao]